jgi:hypothetical protein
MSSWYTRQELTKRIAWFYGGVALANMFGGLGKIQNSGLDDCNNMHG